MSIVAILLLGLTVLTQLFVNYRELEQVLAIRATSSADVTASTRIRDGLLSVHSGSLLAPYAELSMAGLIEISDEHLKEKLALNTRVMRFVPIASVTYRQAMLLAKANQLEQAKIILEQAIWSYPGDFVRAQKQMFELAQKDPAHFSALLEFGVQKAQEYYSAVHQQ